MANYNSVQEILDAGITNMTCTRNNSKQDDGVDQLTGADWLSYMGNAVATIYVSGNTFLGFGSNTEHLKVDRRDTAMWYLYREEGTLYNYYNFIKIRWSGFSAYGQTSASYKLTYDVILFDTGDIMLHMVDIPTSNNDGVYSLVAGNTYSYTVSTAQPDVTFYKQQAGGFEVKNEIAAIQVPFDKKYLIRSGSTLMTVIDGALQTISTQELTSETFQTYGIDEAPASDLLKTLSQFDVLLWYDSEDEQPSLTVEIKAVPPTQTVVTDLIDMSHPSVLGVQAVTVTDIGNPLFAVSFDSKATWEYWTGTAWATASADTAGMTKEVLQGITTDQWAEKIQVGFYLKMILHNSDTVESIVIDFVN